MNEKDFTYWLEEIEINGTYSDRQKRAILRGVYDKIHPTAEELKRATDTLRNSCHWLPTQAQIYECLKDIRKNRGGGKGGRPYTPCEQCSPKAPGVLWLRQSHETKAAIVVGCGCGNTPEGLQTITQIVKGRDDYSIGHFENADGKRPYETDEDFEMRMQDEAEQARERLADNGFMNTVGKTYPKRSI